VCLDEWCACVRQDWGQDRAAEAGQTRSRDVQRAHLCSHSDMSARRAVSSFKTRAPSELKRPIRTRPPRSNEGPASHSSSPTSNARAATTTPTPPRILRPTDVRVIYTDKALTAIAKPSGLMSQPDVSNPVRASTWRQMCWLADRTLAERPRPRPKGSVILSPCFRTS
jgi:23S rRNA-/tRNA-specific pseudouridylate synthase